MGNTRGGAVTVTEAFPLASERVLLVHLDSFDWNWADYGPVELHVGGERVRMGYVGFGNVASTPVLRLVSDDPRYPEVGDVARLLGVASSPGGRVLVPAQLRRPQEGDNDPAPRAV